MLSLVVIDDYPMESQAIEFLLKKERPQIKFAGKAFSGNAGFDLVASIRPDICIVDVVMPDMDGLTLTRKIKESFPDTYVVIASAFDDFSYVQTALREKVCDYLLKPIRPEELFRVLDQIVEAAQTDAKRSPSPEQTILDADLSKQLIAFIIECDQEKIPSAFEDFWAQLLADTNSETDKLIDIGKQFADRILQETNAPKDIPDDASTMQSSAFSYAYHSFWDSLMAAKAPADVHDALHLFIQSCANIINLSLHESGYTQILRAKELIKENLGSKLTLESIAQGTFISPYYLSRLFKKITNMNFIDYVISCRIERAKFLLLSTNQTIDSIAIAVGYDEPNSFRRLFKKKVGISPGEFRHLNKK